MSTIERVGSPKLYLEKFIQHQTDVDKLKQNQKGLFLVRPIIYAITLGAIANIGSLFYFYSQNSYPTPEEEADILRLSIAIGSGAAIAGVAIGILHQALKARSEASKALNLAQECLRNFELYFASTQSNHSKM